MAATLAMGPGAVLSHRSAAELWGIVPRSSRAVDVTRLKNARTRPRIAVHRSFVPEDERTALEGIPATTPPRTVLDLAAVVSTRQLERALNQMEVRGLTDRLSIPNLLARYPRRRGSAVLQALLGSGAGAQGITRNDFEERFAALIDSYELPRPRFNADIAIGGRFISPDCLWADARLIVELDGRGAHGTRRAFEEDRERDRLLVADGWRVIRVTWRQLCDEEARVAADLRKALAQRRNSR